MLAEAWYDNGKIELTGNHRFKHTRFKLRVVVPDEEIMNETPAHLSQDVLAPAKEMLARLDAIRNAPLPVGDDDELTEKQLQRMEAFELRAQMRTEQGRPV